MVWPLTWMVVAGTLPGVVLGGLVRLHWLPDPGPFKAFVGCVLLYIGLRLLLDIRRTIRRALRLRPRAGGRTTYGNGTSGTRIARILAGVPLDRRLTSKKIAY
jgi:uncharacterized membrane protein YfcA